MLMIIIIVMGIRYCIMGAVKRPKRPSHMGREGDSYETKSPMAGFLIFGMVWVVLGITTQNFKTGLFNTGFWENLSFNIAMVKKHFRVAKNGFWGEFSQVLGGTSTGGKSYLDIYVYMYRKCASLNTTQLKSNRCHFQDIAILAFLRKMPKLRHFVWWFPQAIGDFVW